MSSTVCVLIIRQLWDIVQWHFGAAICYQSQPASVCDHCTFFVILSPEFLEPGHCFLLLLLCSPKMMDRFDCIVVLSTIGDVCIEYRISIPGLDKLISLPRAAIRRKSYRGCGLRPGTNQRPVYSSCYQPIRDQCPAHVTNYLIQDNFICSKPGIHYCE